MSRILNSEDIFDLLREWIKKNLKNGYIQPRIFVRNGVAYRFVLNYGDIEFSYEVGDSIDS